MDIILYIVIIMKPQFILTMYLITMSEIRGDVLLIYVSKRENIFLKMQPLEID